MEKDLSITIQSKNKAMPAKNRPTDENTISKQFNKTKESFLTFETIECDLQGDIFFTIADMNQLRKEGIEAFKKAKLSNNPIIEKEYDYQCPVVEDVSSILEVQNKNQIVDFEGDIISELNIGVKSKGNITETRKDYLGHLGKGNRLDVNLNITNSYAIACVLEMGYASMVISDELDLEHCIQMIDAFLNRYGFHAPVIRTVYQKPRLMTMKHCPVHMITKKKNCQECHESTYELISKDGKRALCIGDAMCHMRLYDQNVFNRMDEIDALKEHGMHAFKLIMTDESEKEVKKLVDELKNRSR